MKKYREKEEVLIFKWTGDESVIEKINKEICSKLNEERGEQIFSIAKGFEYDTDKEKTIFISEKWNKSSFDTLVRLNDYIVYNKQNRDAVLSCCNEDWINKNYVEIK
jgi:hypothetical protein